MMKSQWIAKPAEIAKLRRWLAGRSDGASMSWYSTVWREEFGADERKPARQCLNGLSTA